MIECPIDPAPFVIPYIVIVFLFPWIICAISMIRNVVYLAQNGLLYWGLNSEKYKLARQFIRTDPQAHGLYKQLKRWILITAVLWIGGFIILGATLYLMEEHNMLINHSKGLYGPNESKQIPNHGLESTGAPPAADAPETHP